MKIGIRQNKVLCRISGCRVYKDMRPTAAVEETREITNFVSLTRPIRVQNATKRALTRMAPARVSMEQGMEAAR